MIPVGWQKFRLKEISKILFSGVDKKSKSGQKRVFLCNYMDVYKNDYITNDLNFMEATASESEIEKFTLFRQFSGMPIVKLNFFGPNSTPFKTRKKVSCNSF